MLLPIVLATVVCAALDAEGAVLLTGAVATAASAAGRVDVVTTQDLRRALDVEAQRQLVGCTSDEGCLAEIADALGANHVLHGSYAELEGEMFVTLQVFDSRTATSGGRVVARATQKSALLEQVNTEVRVLVAALIEREAVDPAAPALRLLVLDLDPTPVAAPPSWLFAAGITSASIGALALGGGIATDLLVTAPAHARAIAKSTSTQQQAVAAFQERDTWGAIALALSISGALTLSVGGALLLFAMPGDAAP